MPPQTGQSFAPAGPGAFTTAPPAKKSKLPLILGICGGVALITVVLVVALVFLKKPGGSEDAASESRAAASATAAEDTLTLKVNQVDTHDFPEVRIYITVEDANGNKPSGLKKSDILLKEFFDDGTENTLTVEELLESAANEEIYMNLVMDQSGSMADNGLMTQAKSSAKTFLGELDTGKKQNIAITSFDDVIYSRADFTNDISSLNAVVDSLEPDGQTALYDAIYQGILKTNQQSGAKCVIVFTDGMENSSFVSYDEVVQLAQDTGIPVYTIGIGTSYDSQELSGLAEDCGGKFFEVSGTSIESMLAQIYGDVLELQQKQIIIRTTCSADGDLSLTRRFSISCSSNSKFFFDAVDRDYVPRPAIDETLVEDQTIHRYEFVVKDITWEEAFAECQAKGGYLAHINSVAENEYIIQQIKASGHDNVLFWLGGRRDAGSDKYYWVDGNNKTYGKEINSSTYWVADLWMENEPSFRDERLNLDEYYLDIFYYNARGAWVWNDCPNNILDAGADYYSGKIGYICEYD
ncbi:MAG: VWA domain-containing protein [Clostridiales Family XIII bacterium]|nr:VWA domain-containing protein [Clostridiales Family XIII bacterium]